MALLLWLLAACDGVTDPPYPHRFVHVQPCGDNPEVCNGLDDDCDGEVDEGLPVATYYADADGDGFGDPESAVTACSQPTGYVTDATDCDDVRAATHPGATEVAGDGLDDDCDGHGGLGRPATEMTLDDAGYDFEAFSVDGTSYEGAVALTALPGPRPLVALGFPGAYDGGYPQRGAVILANLGTGHSALRDPLGRINGLPESGILGEDVVPTPDFDRDGDEDMLVSTGGTAFLVSSAVRGTVSVDDVAIASLPTCFNVGHCIAAADLDDDGFPEIVSGGTWQDDLCEYEGPVTGDLTMDDARGCIHFQEKSDGIHSIVTMQDPVGDGTPAIAAGMSTERAYLLPQLVGGALTFDDLPVALDVGDPYQGCTFLDPIGDVTGDGLPDLLASCGTSTDHEPVKAGYLFAGPFDRAQGASDAVAEFMAQGPDADQSVPGLTSLDMDGDGQLDVVLGENLALSDDREVRGAISVFYGETVGGVMDWRDDAGALYWGPSEWRKPGDFKDLVVSPDINGDGFDDLLIGYLCGGYPGDPAVTALLGGGM